MMAVNTQPDPDVIGYTSYDAGEATEIPSIEELAAAANAAHAAGAETHWMRARTTSGERPLTREEQLAVLTEMERQRNAREQG